MPLHPRPSCLSTLMVMLNAKDHCCYKSVLITLPRQNTNTIVDGVCALIILTHYKLYWIKQIAQYSCCMAWTRRQNNIQDIFARSLTLSIALPMLICLIYYSDVALCSVSILVPCLLVFITQYTITCKGSLIFDVSLILFCFLENS